MKKSLTGLLRIAMAFVTVTASQAAEIDAVRHISGLPGVKPQAVGKLVATDKVIAFEQAGATTVVEAAQIAKLSTGDEHFLKGGLLGQFARTGVPFAGGLAIGLSGLSQGFGSVPLLFGFLATAITQSRTDVVSLEYYDAHDGYHGAVFTMPWHTSQQIKEMALGGVEPTVYQNNHACLANTNYPHLMTMLPVASAGLAVPAEYRVLTYEHVFSALQRKASGWQVRRSGDTNGLSGCDEWKLALTISAFRKGNATERALLGPLGVFVGTTSLTCRVVLSNSRGDSLLDENIRAVIRGDRESLDLGDEISKLISRKIRKVVAQS